MTSALLHHFRLLKHFLKTFPVFANAAANRLFLLLGIKHASNTLLKSICNKDDLAIKTLTKLTVYTDKCICAGNIWCVSVIRVDTLENIICQK